MKKTAKILLMALSAWILAILCAWIVSAWAGSDPVKPAPGNPDLVILFTHDMHSYFQPHHAMNGEGRIETVGGYAGVAAAIKKERERWGSKALLVDAGDFAEGSLFHTVLPDEALEFRLMGKMGYDALTVGNHDFDFHPGGLAKMLDTVRGKGYPAPPLVVSNLVFSKEGKGDAELKKAFAAYPVRDYLVVERNGLRIGLFGIMGKDAAEDTPYARPASFADPVETAGRVVDLLKNKEKVDLIVCLSHSGTWPVRSHSEDEILADKVPEIDVIISGHTHTTLPTPIVVERNGLRIGLFGIMGKDAAEDTPYATPASFADPVETAGRVVDLLKNKEKVDLIVCLSHSGTWPVRSRSEDEILADKVPGIDVIISGHTHTTLPTPIVDGRTIIVSAGAYATNLGVLALSVAKGKGAAVAGYELVKITAEMPKDPEIAQDIDSFKKIVEERYLSHYGYRFDQAIAESGFDLEQLEYAYAHPEETGLGNLVTDAYRYAVRKAEGAAYRHVDVAVTVLGHIRSSLVRGEVAVPDVFQVLSMGPPDNGYSGNTLIACWLTGRELKDLLEVHTSIAPSKNDAHLCLSGLRFRYNPHRMIFDRVTAAEVEESDGVYRPLVKEKLYRVVVNSFLANLLGVISDKSHGLLKVAIRDEKGGAVHDFSKLVVGGGKPGYELKEWVALAEYLSSFPGSSGNGLPAIPGRYKGPEGRISAHPSWNPVSLVAGGGWLTWGAAALLVVFLLASALVIRSIVRRFAK